MTSPKLTLHRLEQPEPVYDAIVIGAGPAGLTAAMYLSRANLKTLVLEAEKAGGRLGEVKLIENYPGFISVSGAELAERMTSQAEAVGAKIVFPARAVRFALQGSPKVVWTRDKGFRAGAVLLAIGVQRKRLDIPGAREFSGMGVSYCPVCDGTLFKDKDVALIGEDEEAVQDGLYLSELVRKIHFVPGSLKPHYSAAGLSKLLFKGNVQHWAKHEAIRIMGGTVVEKVKIRAFDTKEEADLEVQGVFVSGEKTPVAQMLRDAGVETDSTGCIKVDAQMQTNLEGVYAAGDATCSRKYQISVSVGQAAIAALNIVKKHAETVRKVQ